ncbi:MAG: tungstate ABC transporter ATP-binding protein WtpC [Candidatus Natronoplasma sp.]
MIEIEDVSKSWDDFKISNISLEIEKGEYFVVLGPTGAGKTLLLEILAGFHTPDRGDIYIKGEKFTHLKPNERGFAFVYQDYMLFPHMNVRENIAYGLKIAEKDGIDEKVENIAKKVEVAHLLERDPYTLSGGEKQRVSMARAMVMEPEVLLLDEPFGSVDYQTARKLRDMMNELHKKFKCTVVQVTHNQEEAMILGDRIAVVRDGSIEQVGIPEDIMRKPESRFVADFVGTENIFHAVLQNDEDGTSVKIKGSSITFHTTKKARGEITITIRPEDIILAEKALESSARNNFKGKIVKITDRGNFHEVLLDIGAPLIVYVTKQSVEELSLERGKKVNALFKASAVHVIE